MTLRTTLLALAATFTLGTALAAEAPKTPTAVNEAFKKDQAGQKGKVVTVQGFYMGLTKQDKQVNVSVYTEAAFKADSVLCIFDGAALPEVEKMKQKDPITVTGTIDGAFFQKAKLKDCRLGK